MVRKRELTILRRELIITSKTESYSDLSEKPVEYLREAYFRLKQ
mgnify:CR=1 FL=1